MLIKSNVGPLIRDLDELQREIEAIPVVWNRAIGRIRIAVIHLLKNQASLLRSLQELADSAGGQAVDVKPADHSGGNGGGPEEDKGNVD